MSNPDELMELFCSWIPTLRDSIDITSHVSQHMVTKVINYSRLTTRQKLLVRRRAVEFQFAMRHWCNVLFSTDEITFGPADVMTQEFHVPHQQTRRGRPPLSRGAQARGGHLPPAFPHDLSTYPVLRINAESLIREALAEGNNNSQEESAAE